MMTAKCITCWSVWTAVTLLGLAATWIPKHVREWASDELPRGRSHSHHT